MAVQNDSWDIQRCQKLKLGKKELSPINAKFYDDIQEDYRKLFPLILSFTLTPYTFEDENGVEHVVSSEQVLKTLENSVGKSLIDDVLIIGSTVAEMPQASASSFYGLFYNNYSCNDKAKWTQAKSDFLDKLLTYTDEQLEAKLEGDSCLRQMPLVEWKKVKEKLLEGNDKKEVWESVSGKLANKVNSSYSRVRKELEIQVRQPDNREYCSTLSEMLRLQVKSCYQKNLDHQKVTQELLTKVNNCSQTNPKIFDLIANFSDRLYSIGTGLSKNVLLRSIDCVNKGTLASNPTYKIAIAELLKPEFSEILTLKKEELIRAYNGVKIRDQLKRRKVYPRLPSFKNDYKVMFGLSSLAKFKIRVEDKKIKIAFSNGEEELFMNSHYFHDLEVVFDESNKTAKQFIIKFRHKLKSNKKFAVSDLITGYVKQIGLQKKNGSFYVTLMFTMKHDEKILKLERFFKTASPDMSKYTDLPDKIRVAGFDLNISNPVVGCIAEIDKNGKGPLNSIDFGKGNLVAGPDIVCQDTLMSNRVKRCKQLIFKVKDAIKDCKFSNSNNTKMNDATISFLKRLASPSQSPRCMIQTWIKNLKKRLKKLHSIIRASGYVNISEGLRMLEAQDAMKSLISSYERFHLKSGEMLAAKKNITANNRRQNFRQFISRKIASKIVQYSKGCDVIFIEDLSLDFDSDNKNNSLIRLFSADGLIKCITDAAYKAGIGVVLVDPMGTSKTDPVTAKVGYRNLKNKNYLYVERDGVLGWVDADKIASLNVLIRGLGHSIVPYKFYVKGKKKDVIGVDLVEKEVGKRLQRYFTMQHGSIKQPIFKIDNDKVTLLKKANKGDNLIENAFLYAHGDDFCTADNHRNQGKEIMHRVDSGEPVVEFDLTPCSESGYKSFQAK